MQRNINQRQETYNTYELHVWSAFLFVEIAYVLSVHKYGHSTCKIFINYSSVASTYLYLMFIAPIITQVSSSCLYNKFNFIKTINPLSEI